MEIKTWFVYEFKNGNVGFGDTPQEAIAQAIDSYGRSKDKRYCKFKLYRQGSKREGFNMTMLKADLIGSYNAKKEMKNLLRTLASS